MKTLNNNDQVAQNSAPKQNNFSRFSIKEEKDKKMSYFDDDPDSAELLMRDFDDDMFMDTTENNDLRGNQCFSVSSNIVTVT